MIRLRNLTLRNIALPNGTRQWCLLLGTPGAQDTLAQARFETHTVEASSSDIFLDSERQLFLKAPRLRDRWRDNLAKLVRQTPADKEFRGNRLLRKLGLHTPELLARAIPLNPFGTYRSLLYCRYIAPSTPLNEYMRRHPEASDRARLLEEVARQMAAMLKAGVLFRDFYFGNILRTPAGELVWIDTEVRRYRLRKGRARQRLQRKKQFMSERFGRDGGRPEEWDAFYCSLFTQ